MTTATEIAQLETIYKRDWQAYYRRIAGFHADPQTVDRTDMDAINRQLCQMIPIMAQFRVRWRKRGVQ